MAQLLILLATALLVTALLAGITGQWLAGWAMRPISGMALHAQGISAENLHDRLAVPAAQDELGALAASFNHLLDRLQQSFQQLQRFTADAAHELRAPLAAIRAVGEVSVSGANPPEVHREAISSILEETQRLNHTIDSLLLLARAETGNTPADSELFAVAPLLHEAVSLLAVLAEDKEVELLTRNEDAFNPYVRGDRSLLRVAFVNVVHNAIKFSPVGGKVRLHLTHDVNDAALAVITVSDEGPGMRPEDLSRAFDRFYRGPTASSQEGSGLGLAIVKLIVERMGGDVALDSDVTKGFRIAIRLRCVA